MGSWHLLQMFSGEYHLWIIDQGGYWRGTLVENPQCERGAHSRWLENDLIEVDLMPTNGGRRTPS